MHIDDDIVVKLELTHPSLATIVTSFSKKNAGVSTGLFAFFLFMGSLLFSLLVARGLVETLRIFGMMAIIASLVARRFFALSHSEWH